MGEMILSGGLLNNPLAFGLIIGGIIIVAVAVILYVLVFRAKINKSVENFEARKAAKEEKYNKSVSMAAEIFGERQAEEQQHEAEKTTIDVEELERRIKMNKGSDTYLANPKVKKERAAKKTITEEKKEAPPPTSINTKSQIDQLKQMRGEE